MGYGYIRERVAVPHKVGKPNITSLCDVTLSILVIFLVSSSASVEMIKLALPEARNTATRDINLAVTISVGPKTTTTTAPAGEETAAATAPAGEAATTKPADRKADPWGYYFEDDSTAIEARNLWTALKEIKGDADWSLALIRASKDTPCEYVDILIQCLQGLGVDEFAFVMKSGEDEGK